MGQRHQVFLLARVRPHGAPPGHPGTRRCIAALHHQWCFGSLPLRAMRRLITLISQPDNATVVRAEVRAIQDRYGGPEVDSDTPCPFTANLLLTAWTVDLDLESFYASGGFLLEAWIGCWDGANDDGISVLDVTDPEKPAYCFLTKYEHSGKPGQRDAPLDAQSYLGLYYDSNGGEVGDDDDNVGDAEDDSDGEHNEESVDDKAKGDNQDAKSLTTRQWGESLRNAVQALENVPVLPVSVLREAWPYVRFKNPPQSVEQAEAEQEIHTTSDVSHVTVPNLSDMSLDVAVKQSLDVGDTAEVEKLVWLPGKAARVKAILRALRPFPDSGVHLLSIVLKELKETFRTELTGFGLSGAHVAAVLSALGEVHHVDLSDNTVIVADDIPDIIAAAPTVRRIVLMGCSSVDGARLLELVRTEPSRFKSIEGILHPAFFPVEQPDPYPCAFVYSYVNLGNWTEGARVSIPFFTPAQVVQALTDVIPWQSGLKSDHMQDGEYYAHWVALAAFQGGPRQPGQSANERTVMVIPQSSGPCGQATVWTFVCKMPTDSLHVKASEGWAFVQYTTDSAAEGKGDGSDEAESKYGEVYDLKGFLEWMAKEGRPMPSDQAVEKLESILYLKDEETGEYCCPLMKQQDVPWLG
ncbi:hypothetical protein OH76DRAFT_1553682 [Lentinus brumalis]|uniref:Uncharacterized protein n=1 Tax=Lentinus brumalis TaxID=2498619 RepID=A0A371DKC3_9APHY|nr:hypothetical protein OH76DRAFT_1553682 [Polyporus brumalis]